MFEYLSGHKIIIVTGPQRSGTNICAKMIAHDLGYEYHSERDFGVDSLYGLRGLVSHLLGIGVNAAIHAPALCVYMHHFKTPEVAIVMMMRSIPDIIASQERIGWNGEEVELIRYRVARGPIAAVKYAYWFGQQRQHTKNAYEVFYDNLRDHPLWIDKELRGEFTSHQTELENA